MTGKSGKRFLAAVLTVCLVLSLTVGASAASRFTDVKTSHWAYDEIIDVVDKEIFLRYYYEYQTMEQISASMDIPVGTIKSRLSRGRRRLKQVIMEQEAER